MAIDKALYSNLPLPKAPGSPMMVDIMNPEALLGEPQDVIETEDGGVIIDFDPSASSDERKVDHYENIAEYLGDTELGSLANDLLDKFRADKQSRKDWERSYIKGLDMLGLKIEERSEPWEGACGVFHPMLTEAVVRFQSHAITETFPASGPVRTAMVGREDVEKVKQAHRVQEDMNFFLTEKMTEYRNEHERMLFNLPLAGSAFKKLWYDQTTGRPMSRFVSADDFVVSYGASDLRSAERYTHVMRMPKNEVRKKQVSGYWLDVDLPEPEPEYNDIDEAEDKQTGDQPSVEYDDRYTIYEMHVDLDLPGEFSDPDEIARPYVVTFTKEGQVLCIKRNWYEDDPLMQKRIHFSHYCYMPGLGFYGIGLIHLIGGLAKSATSILRQLIDSGTLANLPGGFKARGLRIKGDDSPIMPGEWRDVDVPGDKVRDALLPLPYKEPSTVLYSLLGTVVEEGRSIGSIADVDISNIGKEAPVGTTLALMERSLKVMSAVQARLHASLRDELKILSGIILDFMPAEYEYSVEGDHTRTQDYSDRVDILPVSDPNAATMSQRVVQYQAALQLSQQAPQLYDLPKLHQQMLEVLGIKDAQRIVKTDDDHKPKDPVLENMCILKGEPVKAFMYQDHEAHIQVHMATMQDPKMMEMVGQAPNAEAIQGAMMSHIQEHVAYAYRRQVEEQLGTPLPSPDEPLPQDVEYQLSGLVAKAAQKLLGKNQQEAAQQKAQEIQEDPVYQLQKREIELKERKQAADEALDTKKMELEYLKLAQKAAADESKLSAEQKRSGAQIGAQIAQSIAQKEVEIARLQEQAREADQQIAAQRQQRQQGNGGQG